MIFLPFRVRFQAYGTSELVNNLVSFFLVGQ